jgi:N-acetylglucosamine-6-phosphate deacetylase
MMRAKTPARCMLVTDAITAAGCPPGIYSLGGLHVELNADGRVSPAVAPGAPAVTHLAGSALSMDRAIGLTVKFTGLPLDEVLKMASTTPAAFIGIDQESIGSIDVEWDEGASTLRIL